MHARLPPIADLFRGRASERQHTWLLNGVYCNLILISRRRFNLIKRHRVCEVSRASTFHECHRRAPVPVSISVLIGDHVDYRWSMGKRDLLSSHFVVRVLTDLSASLSLSKNIALPREVRASESGDFLLAVSRCAVT